MIIKVIIKKIIKDNHIIGAICGIKKYYFSNNFNMTY